jgi:hypothetical protein
MNETFTPTAEVANAAKRALRWLEEGRAGSGFTDVGRRRASQLANRQPVSTETIKRMYSFFSRHEVDKKGKDFDNLSKPSAGRVAWDAWGGDAGYAWSKRIVESMSEKATVATEASAFFGIIKADKQDDGTLLVTGIATDDSVDSDQQICDPDWLKSAMPSWFQWGNIREQHSNIAAGVATEYENKGDEHWITARVVDPASVKKVETGVLKGFSIGIRNPRVIKDDKAAGGRICGGEIVEVSLVDRPANPTCTLTVAKADGSDIIAVEELVEKREVSAGERADLAERGHAMPDGSYPIAHVADLRNAIQSFGRAKDKEAVKEHIIRRARALGATDLLPENWDTNKEMTMSKEETSSEESTEESSMEVTEESTEASAPEESSPEMTSEDSNLPAPKKASRFVKVCKDCKEMKGECKCAEGGYSATEMKAAASEESSQKPGEESSQELGEESSRPGGVAGVAGKASDDVVLAKMHKKLKRIEKSLSLLNNTYSELLKGIATTEDIAKSVQEVTERLSVVEKSPAAAPVRMAVGTPKPAVDENIAKAEEYRAKAFATTDPILAKGYLALAMELTPSK